MAVQTHNLPPDAATGARAFNPPVLLPYAVGLVAGIALERYIAINPVAAVVVLTGLCAALALQSVRRRARWLIALLAATCCGTVLHHRVFRTVWPDDIVQFTTSEPRLARVTGTIVDRPRTASGGFAPFEPWLYQQSRTSCLISVDGVETPDGVVPARGRARIRVKEAALQLRTGARVEAYGWLYRPRPPRNPGAFDWAIFQARRGVRVNLSCARAECVRILEPARGAPWWSLAKLRGSVRRLLLDERLEQGGPEVSVLDAMVLGRRAGVDRKVERAFIETGCAHYLAVSGIHVGMLALAIWWPVRMLGFTKRNAAWAVMLIVVAYALLADPRPPILRAAVMAVAYGLAVILRRPRAALSAACLAAIVILALDPLALFDVGFQLSFLTVVGIMALTPTISSALMASAKRARSLILREKPVSAEIERITAQHVPRGLLQRVGKSGLAALAVALAAWLSALPIVATGFGRVALWGWLSSWLAFPLVFVVMLLGFLRIAVGALAPPASVALDPVLSIAVRALLQTLQALSQLPLANVPVPPIPWWLTLLYYATLLAVAARMRGWTRRGVAPAAVATVVLIGALGWTTSTQPDGVRITQLAVGRGTATVIELPDGDAWIYDAGASGNYDPGAGVVVPFLHHRGIRRVRGVLISHANLDHFGGVPSIIRAVSCGPVYVSPLFAESCTDDGPCAVLLEELSRERHPIRTVQPDEHLSLSNAVSLEVLWPPADPPAGLTVNDRSLVVRLRFGANRVLFCGDIGYIPQAWLIEHRDLSADVLVLPHHGAVVSNTSAFIERVGADVVVRSSFTPTADSAELRRVVSHTPMYSTADHGAIEILLDGEHVRVSAFTKPTTSE